MEINMFYCFQLSFSAASNGHGRLDHTDNTAALKVPCFPLYSILLALNITKVDYLSLDIEGDELAVLKTIPFDEVDITVLSVEYSHDRDKEELRLYMESQGYVVHADINVADIPHVLYVDDFIFVKRDFRLWQ